MSARIQVAVLLSVLFAAIFLQTTEAVGGVAELKALTGDAPYMGVGNQEQAPEYFGDALYRQYYQNPAYGYAPYQPYSKFQMNAARSAWYGGGMSPYYASGIQSPQVATAALGGGVPSPVATAVGGGTGGGFYQGGGNDWVKSR
ncbi:hypothetical protein M3Y99_00990700 [Aphelenchoides fujianensis]|nr:hypothetical protein M3Y99_00990700 [Aphelenchoides fujianensis]